MVVLGPMRHLSSYSTVALVIRYSGHYRGNSLSKHSDREVRGQHVNEIQKIECRLLISISETITCLHMSKKKYTGQLLYKEEAITRC